MYIVCVLCNKILRVWQKEEEEMGVSCQYMKKTLYDNKEIPALLLHVCVYTFFFLFP